MGEVYTIREETLTGIADAVRQLRHESGEMTPAQIEAKIRASKQGLPIHLEEKFLHTNINPITKKWVRPVQYPDLDSIYIGENEEVVYLTYDLRKTPGYGWIGVYVANTTNNTNFYIERGHLTTTTVEVENGQGNLVQQNRVVFVADYTVTRQSTSATTATSPRYFRQDLDQVNGQIQLWRVRSDNTIANFKFVARSATKAQNFNYRMQPCVERVGQLGYITNLSSTSSGTDYAIVGTSHSWCTGWLQRDKMILTGKANNTTLGYSYFGAYSLQQCDVSHWNTSNWVVTTLIGMFYNCFVLQNLDLSPLDTSKWTVNNMSYMFYCDYSLMKVDFTGWDTSKFAVTTLAYMFYLCESLEQPIYFSEFDTSNWAVTSLTYMFYCTHSLRKIDLNDWDTNGWRVTNLSYAFYQCYNLQEICFSDWDTSLWAVTNLTYAFYCLYSLKHLEIWNWDVSNWAVTTLANTFRGCISLVEFDFSHWDTSNWAVTSLAGTFASCLSAEKIDLHYWDTSSWAVTTMTEMFRYDRPLRQIDMSGWDTSKFAVTVMRYAFEGTVSLVVCKISNFKYTGTATNLGTGFPNVVTLKQWDGYEVALAHSYSESISLTPTSLVSIFNRLSTVTGSPKITIGQTNKLKLTAEQLAIATNKGWAVA